MVEKTGMKEKGTIMNMKTGDLFRGEMNVSVVTELKATY
jgi:hypothetical protein